MYESGAINIYNEDIEYTSTLLKSVMVRREQKAFAIGMEEGGPVRTRKVGDFNDIRSIDIGDVDIERAGFDHAFAEEFDIAFLIITFRSTGSPYDFLGIAGEEGAAIVADFTGKLEHIARGDFISPEVEVAGARRGKDDVFAIWRDRCFGIIGVAADEDFRVGSIRIGNIDIVFGVNGPNIAIAGHHNGWRAVFHFTVCGAEDDASVRHEIGAGSTTLAIGDWNVLLSVDGLTIGTHAEDLITARGVDIGPIALEDEFLIVEAPIGFGVIATEGKLADIAKVVFPIEAEGVGGRVVGGFFNGWGGITGREEGYACEGKCGDEPFHGVWIN